MGNNYYFLQAGPLEFCQYPYTPGSGLAYGKEEHTVQLLEDGSVKFSVYDPAAERMEVEFTEEDRRIALVKDDQDVWRAVVSGIPAGLRYMKWYKDGVEMIQKKAPVLYGFGGVHNYVEIPEENEGFYHLKQVPHGSLRTEYYESQFTGETRSCIVYTPPSYDANPDKAYPVLYLLNGGGENETAWSQQGKINFILDNLIAEGKCGEMLAVMNAGYVFSTKEWETDDYSALMDNISQLLMRDCIPFIEQKFRVIPDRAHRAVCGASAGASQTQWMAIHYPELVDYVGVFSGRLLEEIKEQPGHYDPSSFYREISPGEYNALFQYVLYARGLDESGQQQKAEAEFLRAEGYHIDFYTAPGRHEWHFWRKAVREFITHLFK
ncbi:MAG: hypothetical protein LUH00_03210 [Lachnospiraceae bacterium]|nr:hypothetical protein [Lachnospiraceae bacterium]